MPRALDVDTSLAKHVVGLANAAQADLLGGDAKQARAAAVRLQRMWRAAYELPTDLRSAKDRRRALRAVLDAACQRRESVDGRAAFASLALFGAFGKTIDRELVKRAVEHWPGSSHGKWPAVRALARELGCDAVSLRVLLAVAKT